MKQPDWAAERADAERIAQEYRARGYDVIVAPAASDVPDFLHGLRPDIVARGPKDSILIEIQNRESARDAERLRALASRVEGHPGWRLVVVSAGTGTRLLPDENVRPLNVQKIREMLAEGRAFLRSGHQEAAILVSWAALEAAMRCVAERHTLDLPRPDTWSLMRELVSNGLLERDAYQPLTDAFRLRSAFAHGFAPVDQGNLARAFETLHGIAETLMRDCEHPDGEDLS